MNASPAPDVFSRTAFPTKSQLPSSVLFRYFFAVLAILTVLGMLNGLVLLPVLLSLMGPPPEVPSGDAASHLPTSSPEPPPLPPPMAHHGYDYAGGQRGPRRQAFSESSDSEYYSETTSSGTSGIGSEGDYGYCDRSAYAAAAAPPPHSNPADTSHILLEASRNPSFPKLTVVKPFKENTAGVCGTKELLNESSHNAHGKITRWDAGNKPQGPPSQPLPSDRTHFPGRSGHCGPRLQGQQSRTKGPGYGGNNKQSALATQQGPCGGPVTMVTATASVTVAVQHPNLPGAAYQEYTHGAFDVDSESDCFEDTNARTCGGKTNSYKRDSLDIQDLEQGQLQLRKT
ncbi:unnamed protein product [Merluccius merluccius]